MVLIRVIYVLMFLKFSPCLIKHKDLKGCVGREMQLHAFLTSVLDGVDKLSVLPFSCFISLGGTPIAISVGGWVIFREKRFTASVGSPALAV
jgi:hypothetical protein